MALKSLLKLFIRSPAEMGIVTRMLSENFRVHRTQYIVAITFMIITAGITAFSAWLMGPIVKDVFYGNDVNQAFFLAGVVIAVFLLKGFLTYFQTVILSRIGNNIVARYQRRVFDHLMNLDVSYFGKQHSVMLISRINANIFAVRSMLNTLILGYARDLVTVVALIAVMVYRDPVMAAAVFIIGPLALIVLAQYAKRVRKIGREEVQITAQVTTSMQEASHGIEVVKAFTMEDQLRQKLGGLTERAEARSNKIARITARTSPLMETLSGVAIGAVIAYGGYRVATQGYEPSDLTSFMTALLLAYDPAKRLARLRVVLERTLVDARLIYHLLDTPIRGRDEETGEAFTVESGVMEFKDVTFAYSDSVRPEDDDVWSDLKRTSAKSPKRLGSTNSNDDGDHDDDEADGPVQPEGPPVLHSVSFVAEAGKTTALVGPSGGGKSTILALLQRFYDPRSGIISIDGRDIATANVSELRGQMAFVSQHPVLFEGTVRENLRFGRPEATDAEIEQAAQDAQAHEFIVNLPDGYDTPLGENGANLSGGQRQRVSIARAILRDAPILLLDEATSALDNQSEALVQEALETLMEGRTTLMIAHRLSTISGADSIIVIDSGRVVEQGSHAQLMKHSGGLYADLSRLSSLSDGPQLDMKTPEPGSADQKRNQTPA
ncbi:MAG: ABC transporter ATP-binding protein [Pseudomonadota bacterium]